MEIQPPERGRSAAYRSPPFKHEARKKVQDSHSETPDLPSAEIYGVAFTSKWNLTVYPLAALV